MSISPIAKALATGALVLTLVLPVTWAPVDSAALWLLMALMGVLAAGGHFMLTMGYQYASAVTLMPYLYCQVGFAVLAGMVFFDHAPDGASLAGMALISLAAALPLLRWRAGNPNCWGRR